MAAFLFNFQIEGSTADCKDRERNREFEKQPMNVGSTVAIGVCTRGRDESEGLKSASLSDHNGELEHKCGLVSISEDSVTWLYRPGGVCALLQGAQMVVFQDYNVEVLMSRTIPTAFHNSALSLRDASLIRDVEEFSSACQFVMVTGVCLSRR